MPTELKKVRRELELAKAALKVQAVRCRQIVAALVRKLQEKENELRASCDLRDQQLSCVLRSLFALEGRLRKEQKIIRQKLQEKDEVIERQERLLQQFQEGKEKSPPQSPSYNVSSGEERLDSLCRSSEFIKTENTYKDNPVLESVNQILLKDEEDLLTELSPPVNKSDKNGKLASGVEWYDADSSLIVPERPDSSSSDAWCIKVIEEEAPAPPNSHDRLWVKEKTSPPIKALHFEEKACLQMSKRTLTVAAVLHKDLEEVDNINNGGVSECSYQELVPVGTKPIYQKLAQKPPALPPKPTRLLKPSELLARGEAIKFTTSVKPATQPKPKIHAQEVKRKQMNGHVPGNAKSQSPFVDPNERALPSPGARLRGVHDNKLVSPDVSAPITIRAAVRPELCECVPTRHDIPDIRMGSSVSSLITGAARDSIVTELTVQPLSPPISSNAESTEDPLQENFEEFKLEESYGGSVSETDGRPEAEGAETLCHYSVLSPLPPPPPDPRTMPAPPAPSDPTRTYETFLETTGLSQKSILTPSRMLSNHRSCLKPKDVKHRSRVKAAAVEKCASTSLGPTVKYWTEPYL